MMRSTVFHMIGVEVVRLAVRSRTRVSFRDLYIFSAV